MVELQARRWYISGFKGKEALRTNIGFLMGKNPNHGFSIDFELRISNHLSDKCSIETQVDVARCNYRTTDGQKVQVYGITVDRSLDRIITAAIRTPKHVNGLYIFLRADKNQEAAYNRAILNIKYIPEMYTGIPIIGISSAGAEHLRQELQVNPPNTPTPIDLEGTHLSERLGKYMVTTPLSCIAAVKAHVEILLSKNPSLYLDEKFPTGPMLQERRRAPIQGPDDKDNDSNPSIDPYGDMSIASVGSSKVSTAMSYRARQQQAIAALVPLKPHRPNAWHVTLPKELLSPATVPTTTTQNSEPTQEQAFVSPSSSVSGMSQISALTEENSSLKRALIEKSNELEVVQGTLTTQIKELQTTMTKANENHAVDTIQLKLELQNTLDSHHIQQQQVMSQMKSAYELQSKQQQEKADADLEIMRK